MKLHNEYKNELETTFLFLFFCHQVGAGVTGPGGRRALELILSGGLKSLARPAKPVRRAASRDSVLSQPQPLLEGIVKSGNRGLRIRLQYRAV